MPLYTVWLVDDGKRCPQIPRRFYASVNGNMITSGLLLARATGDASYREQALATAHAIDTGMSDGAGIFEDLQAENDVVEPLVEAFYDLAKTEDEPFARDWILRNAAASDSATTYEGSYGRFWGGPRPKVATTCFQANGGFALAFAAAALAPEERPLARDVWTLARHVTRTISALPAKIDLDGRAIAIMGAIGDRCCEEGHIRVLLDGVETFDGTGIWQNKSSAKKTIPDSVLFAWRWPESGHHTIDLLPGQRNPKEGSTFVHVEGYDVVP